MGEVLRLSQLLWPDPQALHLLPKQFLETQSMSKASLAERQNLSTRLPAGPSELESSSYLDPPADDSDAHGHLGSAGLVPSGYQGFRKRPSQTAV